MFTMIPDLYKDGVFPRASGSESDPERSVREEESVVDLSHLRPVLLPLPAVLQPKGLQHPAQHQVEVLTSSSAKGEHGKTKPQALEQTLTGLSTIWAELSMP